MAELRDAYLGDGVYASFDGQQIWLETRAQTPVNKIALNSETLKKLRDYEAMVQRFVVERTEPPGKCVKCGAKIGSTEHFCPSHLP